MKKLFIIIVFVAIGKVSYGQTDNNTGRILNQDMKNSPVLKKTGNIKYIDISISQPGVEECMGTNIPIQDIDNDWIEIYPNPSQGKFTLELTLRNAGSELLVQIFDMAGKLEYENRVVTDGRHLQKDLDVNHLQKGVYFIRVMGKDRVGVKQIIIN
jgi:hypothetical protein